MTDPIADPPISSSLPLPPPSGVPITSTTKQEKRVLQVLTAFAQREEINSHKISDAWGLVFQEIERVDSDLDEWLGNLQPDEPQVEENDILSATVTKTVDILAQLTKPAD